MDLNVSRKNNCFLRIEEHFFTLHHYYAGKIRGRRRRNKHCRGKHNSSTIVKNAVSAKLNEISNNGDCGVQQLNNHVQQQQQQQPPLRMTREQSFRQHLANSDYDASKKVEIMLKFRMARTMLWNQKHIYRVDMRRTYHWITRRYHTWMHLHLPHRLRGAAIDRHYWPGGKFRFRRYLQWLVAFLRRSTTPCTGGPQYQPFANRAPPSAAATKLPNTVTYKSTFWEQLTTGYLQYFMINHFVQSMPKELNPIGDCYNRAIAPKAAVPFELCDLDTLVEAYFRPFFWRTRSLILRALRNRKLYIAVTVSKDQLRPQSSEMERLRQLGNGKKDTFEANCRCTLPEWNAKLVCNIVAGILEVNGPPSKEFLLAARVLPCQDESESNEVFYTKIIKQTLKSYQINFHNILLMLTDSREDLLAAATSLSRQYAFPEIVLATALDDTLDDVIRHIRGHYPDANKLFNEMDLFLRYPEPRQMFLERTGLPDAPDQWPPRTFFDGMLSYTEHFRTIERFFSQDGVKRVKSPRYSSEWYSLHVLRNLFKREQVWQEMNECKHKYMLAFRRAQHSMCQARQLSDTMQAIETLRTHLEVLASKASSPEADAKLRTTFGCNSFGKKNKSKHNARKSKHGKQQQQQNQSQNHHSEKAPPVQQPIFEVEVAERLTKALRTNPGFYKLYQVAKSITEGSCTDENLKLLRYAPIYGVSRRRLFRQFSMVLRDYPESFPEEYFDWFAVCYCYQETQRGDKIYKANAKLSDETLETVYRVRKMFTEPIPRRGEPPRAPSELQKVMLNMLNVDVEDAFTEACTAVEKRVSAKAAKAMDKIKHENCFH